MLYFSIQSNLAPVNYLKKYLRQLAMSADVTIYDSFEDKKRSILLQLFSYLFLLLMLGFIIYNSFGSDYLFLAANSLALVIGVVLYYLYRSKQKLNLVTMTFVVVIMTLTTFFIQTGGIEKTGLYFSILIPLPTILLIGRRKGLYLLLVFVIVNILGIILFQERDWFPHYDWIKGGRLTLVFFLIATMAYFNEYVFEVLYSRIQKLSDWLVESQQSYKNLAVNKEHFVSLMTNNLGDHIGSFSALANLLNEEYDNLDDKRKREIISSLADFSQQNYRLLHDLMRWSTALTDIIPFTPKAVKLEKIYRNVIELFNAQIVSKKLSFFLKMRSNSELFGDEDMIGAVLRIFVSNAIKFSRNGGEIRIAAEEAGDYMRITISDNGVGMSPENLMRVNASVSFSTPGTLDEPGTGIGLILAKEFLQQNRGSFHAESKLGEGTQIVFTIPLVD